MNVVLANGPHEVLYLHRHEHGKVIVRAIVFADGEYWSEIQPTSGKELREWEVAVADALESAINEGKPAGEVLIG